MNWQCPSECAGDCCGCVPFNKTLWASSKYMIQRAVAQEMDFSDNEVVPLTHDGKCVFLSPQNKCVIYPFRPNVCRDYGTHPDLPCPRVKPNGQPRSEAGRKKWQRIIDHMVDAKMKALVDKQSRKPKHLNI